MSRDQIRKDLQCYYPLSDAQFQRLERLVEDVLRWQKKTNLVAPSTLSDIWLRHVADSLQCLALKPEIGRWLDLGSGGGFPGLVIAAVLAKQNGKEVTLVEANNKKAAFLRRTNRRIGGQAKVVATRIENLVLDGQLPQIVTARALSSLGNVFEIAEKWLSAGATGLFHKGRDYAAEIEECNGVWYFDLVMHKSLVAKDSMILEISNLERISR